jgi:hypothetical protein
MSSDEIDIIYVSGWLAGSGDTSETCKYVVGSEQKEVWDDGFEEGIRAYFKSLKKK